MAKMAMKLANAVPSGILRSPLHPIMSGKYAIIEFTGRKSGRVYKTPVAYVRQGDTLLMSTDSAWWRNLSPEAPVSLVLRGRRVRGTGRAVQDPERSAQVLRSLVDAIPSYAKPAELEKVDGRVSDEEIQRAVRTGRVSIEVALD